MNAPAPQPASNAEGWTVQRILEWTATFLRQKGVESARLEAELLLAHARKCPRIRLYTDFTVLLSDEERASMRELVQRRAKREPLAYIVGSREFYGRSFEVTQGVLIPRPETETLVDVCLEQIPKDTPREILEVGFGSGCISITIAKLRPLCSVIATDISSTALNVAARNSEKHGVSGRVTLLHGNILDPVMSYGRRFDGLVSNPPYIREDERSELAPEVAVHEPPEALFSGTDGLDVVRRIIDQSPSLLKPGAFIAMELDPSQCSAAAEMLQAAGFTDTGTRRDLSGNERIVQGRFQRETTGMPSEGPG